MSTETPTSFLFNQLEEALEERQRPDRRQKDLGHAEHSAEERRKGDRRASAAAKRNK